MKKFLFITIALILFSVSAFAQAIPTPTEYLILTSQASQRAADSTRAAAVLAAAAILQTTADECSTEANNAAASAAVAVSELAEADSLFGVKRAADSTAFAANVTAVSALPTTTHISNVQSVVDAIDPVVDTLALRNWIVKTGGAAALPSDGYDTAMTITGLVEIAYLGAEFTVALGTQTTLMTYWANDLALSDSSADLTGVQPGTMLNITGTFANAVTVTAATTEAVAGAPGVFRARDCVIRLLNQRADAGTARVKHTVVYRPLSQGSKIVMAD